MKLHPLLVCAFCAAIAPSLNAANQKPVAVTSLGSTTIAEASARAAATPSLYKSDAASMPFRQALKPMPKPITATVVEHKAQAFTTAQSLSFAGFPVVAPDSTFLGFDAIDSTDSAIANRFTLEPPDQGLATDGKDVLEAVNLALQVFSTTGAPLSKPVSLYSFFKVSPNAFPDGSVTELSDPRAFYDWESNRWFVTILSFKISSKGALVGGSQVLIAVSAKGDPLGSYNLSSVDVSDATFGKCPCLGDQPLLGINQDGVYLNTNDYSDATGAFQTALVTAISKRDLIAGSSTVTAVSFDGLTVAEGVGFSIQPSFPAPNTSTSANLGTEFFTSSLDFGGFVDNRLAVWALTNTQSLNDRVPNLNLQQTVIHTQEYGYPTPATQKAGAFPFGQSLGANEELIDTGDDRMMQLYNTNGTLYCALNTRLLAPRGAAGPRTGIAWFAIRPDASFASLSAKVSSQGLIGIANGSVMYPSFAVNSSGDGVIAFSLTGKHFYPSTAYTNFHKGMTDQEVHLAGIGQRADDGFSGYPQVSGTDVGRWGDYSAAMVSPNGDLWMAAEYIPNPSVRPRTNLTNWGTFISMVK